MTALRLLAVTFGINPESLQFPKEPQIHIVANWYLLTQVSKWHFSLEMALLEIFIVYAFCLY